MFKFRSLSVKMTVYFSTLITLVLLIVGMITYYKSSKLIEDGVIQISGEVLKKMTTNIDYYFRDAESLSKGIAIDGLIQNLLIRNSAKNDMIYDEILRSVKDKLSNYANTRVNITRIMVVNDKGELLDDQLQDYSGKLNEISWYSEFVTSKSNTKFIGVHESLYNWFGGRVFTIAQKIYSMSTPDLLIGYVFIDLDDSLLKKAMSDFKLLEGGKLYLLDSENQPVFEQDSNPLLETIRSGNQQMLDGEGTFLVRYENKPYMAFYAKSNYSSWRIVEVVPYQTLIKDMLFQRNMTVVLIILSILCSILISLLIIKSTHRPLIQILSAMKRVEKGDFSIQVAINTNDEIERLGEGFNKMAKELSDLFNEVVQKEQLKRDAEISALQAQINPHFLYNTLNVIRFLAKKHEVTDIRDLVNALISLYRSSIESTKHSISLQQEMELVGHYLLIQKMRYGDVFQVDYDITKEIIQCLIPRFSIQPLIENALFHGIIPKGGGRIQVKMTEHEKGIQVMVTDNGVGFNNEKLLSLKQAMSQYKRANEDNGFNRVGLKNIQDRIRLEFGEQYGLSIESQENAGSTITLLIPKMMRGTP